MGDLKLALNSLFPSLDAVEQVSPVGGGCISEARRVRVRFDDGNSRDLFVKSNAASFLDNFEAEWDGLTRLSNVGAIRVPKPLAVGVVDGRSWLVLPWCETGSPGAGYFEGFAKRLAALHRCSAGAQVGLVRDNYLGSAKQVNTPSIDWAEFFAVHRIGYQIRWAVSRGLDGGTEVDGVLRRDCEQIMRRMPQLLGGREEATSLLHGDLWSGNYLCAADGEPVLIDPAVYHGCREAEFGMLKLFGSCPAEFYETYLDHFPLPAGWQQRVQVYLLYHLLNHLNLFGCGYLGQCRSTAAAILRH